MRKTNVIRLLPDRRIRRILKEIGDRVSRLWNTANFICRQSFFSNQSVPSYARLCSILKTDENYRSLPSHIAQEVIKKVSLAWKSYFRLLKLYNSGRLKEMPGLPRYRKNRKTGKRPFNYIPIKSSGAYSVDSKNFSMTLPSDLRKTHNGRLNIPLRGLLRYRGSLKTCELEYDDAKDTWYAHIVVEVSESDQRKDRPLKVAAGDIGAKRSIAIAIEGSKIAYVFSAGQLWKDYKYWSRRISEEQSRLSTQGLKTSRRLRQLYRKRKLRLRHAMEAMAKMIVLILRKERVTRFVVGYPRGCREEMNFGQNNALVHNFWSYNIFLNILEKHCQRHGIEFERVSEDGTSDVCHVCGREVKRPVRSVIVCPEHGRYHADVNAAINLLHKYLHELRDTPIYGDGVEATPAWVTYEWNKHLWLPRAKSLRYVSTMGYASQVLQVIA